MAHQYSLQMPKSIHEARERLAFVEGDLEALDEQLKDRKRTNVDGSRMTTEEYASWHGRAKTKRLYMIQERGVCKAYIKQYQEEVRREELSDPALLTATELERLRLEQAKVLREIETQRAKEEEHTKRKQAQVEVQRLQLEMQKRKYEVRSRNNLLLSEEPVDPRDADNLIRHSWRLLKRLNKEGRAQMTQDELDLLGMLETFGLDK